MLDPIQELTKAEIARRKEIVFNELIRRATKETGTRPCEWLVRDLVVGDDSAEAVLGDGFIDLGIRTEQTPNLQGWAQDAVDITVDKFSSVLAANEKVPDEKFIAAFGVYDLSPEGGELLATVSGGMIPHGTLVAIRLRKGASEVKATWHTEHLYTYPHPSGIATPDSVAYFDQNDAIDFQQLHTEATLDKFIGYRAWIAEKFDKIGAMPGLQVKTNNNQAFRAYVEPLNEVPIHIINDVKQKLKNKLIELAIKKNTGTTAEDWVAREAFFGDESHAIDIADFDFKTAAVVGIQNYVQANADLTALNLSDVLVANEKVPDNKFFGVYGFGDKSSHNSLTGMAFLRGAATRIGFYETECCYVQPTMPAGLFLDPLAWEAVASIGWQINVKSGAYDTNVVLRTIIVEPIGEEITPALVGERLAVCRVPAPPITPVAPIPTPVPGPPMRAVAPEMIKEGLKKVAMKRYFTRVR